PRAQVQAEYAVVVLDHVEQRREAPVVVEAALLVRPEALERRRAVALVWRALRLEVVDPDLFGGVHVPTGLRVERRHVAARAVRAAPEQLLAARGGRTIEAAARGPRRGERQLVEVKRRELGRDAVLVVAHVAEPVGRGQREL